MNKKLLSVFLALAIIVQLAFPVGALVSAKVFENNFEKYGRVYKIKLSSLNYDCNALAINGEEVGTVYYELEADLSDDDFSAYYAQVTVSDDGYAKLEFSNNKPTGNNYLKNQYWKFTFLEENLQIKRFGKINGVSFVKAETGYEYYVYEAIRKKVNDLYVEAKIYKGKGVALDFYVDGEKLEDVLSDLNNRL